MAKEVWELSHIPVPLARFSCNSVFLNLHFLFSCSVNKEIDLMLKLAFPWILWHIWKARNLFFFEHARLSASKILEKALEEALVWLKLNNYDTTMIPPRREKPIVTRRWVKPPPNLVKCNVGCSWSPKTHMCGGSWLVRDARG